MALLLYFQNQKVIVKKMKTGMSMYDVENVIQ